MSVGDLNISDAIERNTKAMRCTSGKVKTVAITAVSNGDSKDATFV